MCVVAMVTAINMAHGRARAKRVAACTSWRGVGWWFVGGSAMNQAGDGRKRTCVVYQFG